MLLPKTAIEPLVVGPLMSKVENMCCYYPLPFPDPFNLFFFASFLNFLVLLILSSCVEVKQNTNGPQLRLEVMCSLQVIKVISTNQPTKRQRHPILWINKSETRYV
uniref:Uncharacterized protein n=1 Tax=Oryza brachyantha TaxID=4533 RepID=J3L093_ORYBR